MQANQSRPVQLLPVIVASAVIIAQLAISAVDVGNAEVKFGAASTLTRGIPTTTPTATSTAGTVTPVPLGTWVGWPERPTDELHLEDIELRDVYFPSPDEGWAVGSGSNRGWNDVAIILHYRDGEWAVDESLSQTDRDNMRLYAIDGTGPDNIWAVGKDYQPLIYRGGDIAALVHYDGERWIKFDVESLRLASRAVLNDIDMLMGDNGVEGWAISQRSISTQASYVLHLIDGRWEKQTEINGQDLTTIDMVDATDGWIVSKNADDIAYYYWYHNGRWQNKSSWGAQMFGVSMADALYGWAVGPDGSADEYIGECHDPEPNRPCHWYQYTIPGPNGRVLQIDLYDIQLLSRYDGWLVGSHRQVASSVVHYERHSRDITSRGSLNWQLMEIASDPVENLYGIYMLPGPGGWATDGWAVGEDGAILHYEGPTPPATATPTPTNTATATPTNTITFTPTNTATPTPTATMTRQPTSTATPTPSPTVSPTPEPPQWHIYLPFIARNNR